MNIDMRVIGITGSNTMLLSDTYVISPYFLFCALRAAFLQRTHLFHGQNLTKCLAALT